jgi:dihydroorotase
MPKRTLFKGIRVVDPASETDEILDVLVEDELIAEVGSSLAAEKAEAINGDGLVLAPGLVDLHAHLREPGFEHKETVETGTRAAAAGGYTALCSMPNTDPVTDNLSVVAEIRNLADKAGLCEVIPAAAIT